MTVEKHVRFSEDVDTLAAAWYFVMNHVDEFTTPTISIKAWTRYGRDNRTSTTGFTAKIHGNVNA